MARPGRGRRPFRPHKHAERVGIDRAPAAACYACPLTAQCTTGDHGRRVRRSGDEAYLDRVRGDHATEPYRKAMRKRQISVEPLCAEAKEAHGLRRFRLRGLMHATVEAPLIAIGQNLQCFLAATGWGWRHAARGGPVPSRDGRSG